MILLARQGVLCTLVSIYWYVLFARVILSWFPRIPEGLRPVTDVIFKLTEPVIRWARPLIPPVRVGAVALDLSILVVFLVLGLVRSVVCGAGI